MNETAVAPAFEPIVELKKMPKEDLERAKSIAKDIDITDTNGVIQFGVSAQTKVATFADTMLQQIRAKDAGYAGDILSELVISIKDIDVGSLDSGSMMDKVPLLGALMSSIKRFIARYEKMSVKIDKLIMELEKARMSLMRDITMLDGLYEKNTEYLQEIDVLIAAGQIKLEELREKVLPEMQAAAQNSNDPVDAQKLQDFQQCLTRFERKLHDLKLSRMVSIQTNPQIRLIQNNDQALAEKIQSSILNTIPLWKNQIIIAISIFRQKKAVKLQKEVTDTTNELLMKNSEMLKQGSIDIARETERGIVDMETLKKVNQDLISTIEETLRIQEDGRQKRTVAEKELVQLEDDLKLRLRSTKTIR